MRGGRTTKIPCPDDAGRRIVVLALTTGNVADITMALAPLVAMRPTRRPAADKAYDADPARNGLDERQIEPVIPGRAARNVVYPSNRGAYRRRNAIERMFGRLRNWNGIATLTPWLG